MTKICSIRIKYSMFWIYVDLSNASASYAMVSYVPGKTINRNMHACYLRELLTLRWRDKKKLSLSYVKLRCITPEPYYNEFQMQNILKCFALCAVWNVLIESWIPLKTSFTCLTLKKNPLILQYCYSRFISAILILWSSLVAQVGHCVSILSDILNKLLEQANNLYSISKYV